jgi:hypothetical protein
MGEEGGRPVKGPFFVTLQTMNSSGAKSALTQSLSDQSGDNPATSPKVNVSLSNLRNVEGDIPMRTILLGGLAAVGLALAATSGASAQYYSNYGYSYGYPSYNYGYSRYYGYKPYYSYRPAYRYGYSYRYY